MVSLASVASVGNMLPARSRLAQEGPLHSLTARTEPLLSPVQLGSRVRRYGIAVLVIAVFTLLRMPVQPWIATTSPYIPYTIAVLIASYLGGYGPGFLSFALSIVSGVFFFEAPEWSFAITDKIGWTRLAIYGVVGPVIWLVGATLGHAMVRLREQSVEILTAMERLRQSEDRYARAASLALQGDWTMDPTGCASFVSARSEELLGYAPHELRARPLADLCYPDDRQKLQEFLTTNDATTERLVELRFLRRDGKAVWCVVTAHWVYNVSGEPVSKLFLLSDVLMPASAS